MFNFAALIGGIIGFFLGWLSGIPFAGFIGALIGGSVGSSLGARVVRRRTGGNARSGWTSGWPGGAGQASGTLFFESLFSMLGRLAAADGLVSADEERVIRQAISSDLGIRDPRSIETAMGIFRNAAAGTVPFGQYARKAREAFRYRPQLLEVMLEIMVRVAAADGTLHTEEDRLLREAASIFGLGPGYYEALKARYGLGAGQTRSGGFSGSAARPTSRDSAPYAVLGVSPSATDSEVRRAYRKKAAEYHPDKIAAKGLPKDFTDFANGKFREIQTAWESVKKERNL